MGNHRSSGRAGAISKHYNSTTLKVYMIKTETIWNLQISVWTYRYVFMNNDISSCMFDIIDIKDDRIKLFEWGSTWFFKICENSLWCWLKDRCYYNDGSLECMILYNSLCSRVILCYKPCCKTWKLLQHNNYYKMAKLKTLWKNWTCVIIFQNFNLCHYVSKFKLALISSLMLAWY